MLNVLFFVLKGFGGSGKELEGVGVENGGSVEEEANHAVD